MKTEAEIREALDAYQWIRELSRPGSQNRNTLDELTFINSAGIIAALSWLLEAQLPNESPEHANPVPLTVQHYRNAKRLA